MTQPPNPPSQPPALVLEYSKSPAGVREIAKRQRAILLCILAEILIYLALVALQSRLPPPLPLLIIASLYVINIVATVYIFLLTTKLYGTGMGILCGVLTLIPCLGLIVLLSVNGKATTLLRAAGLKVGLLGATIPNDFPA